MFHWKDGWFFERTQETHLAGSPDVPDLGVVHIIKRDYAHLDAPVVCEAFIPAAEWASIIASVSVQGETPHTWPLAVAFHMGGEPLKPSGG